MSDMVEDNVWQTEPTQAGFCWVRNLEEKDVIVEVEDVRETSDSEPEWMIVRHGRSASKPLGKLPREIRFSPRLLPPE